jgi:hypothetical protein
LAAPDDVPADATSGPARRETGGRSPLYVVCSPRRRVGKTLLARLLTEFHVLEKRPVAAFDLADEGPQLADYLPDHTRLVDLRDIRGQMAFFDGLLADAAVTKVIDVSHRAFADFFLIAHKIGFFDEALRHGLAPLILFAASPDPKSVQAYAMIGRWFAPAALLPVRNHAILKGFADEDSFPSTVPVSLEIPALSLTARTLVEQPTFAFDHCTRELPHLLPQRLTDELQAWVKRIFLQFREIELFLMWQEIVSALK